MKEKIIYFVFTFLICAISYAQNDSIVALDKVILSDVRLNKEKDKSLIVKLSDSILQNHNGSFTELIRQHTSLYLKENGLGMVSSPSFRGTNASQTAVIWNGININSQTTGQTDFNNLGMESSNTITIKSGGGSSFYGSGAIGGSIHLQHEIDFRKKQTFSLGSAIGSYDNFIQNGNVTISNEKSYFNGFIKHQSADNDYPYLNSDLKNDNAQIENFSAGYNTAFKLGKRDVLKTYYTYFTNNRNLSRTIAAPAKSRLEDKNRRFMIAWNRKAHKTTYNIRVANLEEEYKYFENKRKKHLFSGSEVSSYIANADVDYKFSNTLNIKAAADGNLIEGEGDNIGKNTRRNIAGILALTHNPFKNFSYTITGRKEITNAYKVPLIGSLDLNYKVLNWYTIGINGSKNFRTPTYNDLYWDGLGNPDLRPETSYQANFNHFFSYKKNTLQLAAFYIDTEDMIKWTPDSSGKWQPQNFANVINYGIEASLHTAFTYKKHHLNLSGTYAYVKAIDQETDKQLIYVPIHKANGNISYHYKKLTVFYENVFTDDVFTNASNTKGITKNTISNTGVSYNVNFNKNNLKISGRINNIFNKEYQNVISRPMPNTNFLISINYKYN